MTITNEMREMLDAATQAIGDAKGSDLFGVEVGEILAIVDVFLLCSAMNPRQVAAVAERVEEYLAVATGRRPIAVEGLDERRWVLMDYGDLVIHVFHEEERAFYRLERLYGDAPQLDLDTVSISDS